MSGVSVLGLWLACAMPAPVATPDDPVPTPPDACRALDEAACDADPACWSFYGWACDADTGTARVWVACLGEQESCGDIGWACRPEGSAGGCELALPAVCEFAGGYCPDGWEGCDSGDGTCVF